MDVYFNNCFIQVIAAIITTIGFGIIFNIKGKNLFHTGIAGGISWAIFLLGKYFYLSDGPTYFLATLCLSIYSEIMARKLKTPVTTLLIAALIPLAPGGGIYYMMYNIIEKNYLIAFEKGMSTFIIAGAMSIGIFTATNIMRIVKTYSKIL
ncbi:threonine/serine exporter family protein [Fusobacterium perfoetens]|uniref:threonine/serine exporter family protein n=1 Tax=Fusobacterium perfoetens TaxID=852 RepID=UPI0004829BCC|nr:threonine/serine exporter family protein [Fusobacterium perfoetens]